MSSAPKPDAGAISATWRWLAHEAYGVSEVRVIRRQEGVVGIGFFDREDAFVRECIGANVGANVYVGIQPRPRRFLARAANTIRPLRRGARNEDIEVLLGTVIDLDPVRPKDEAATLDELATALAAARKGAQWCQEQALRPPLLMMSGNGAQLWFAVPAVVLAAPHREPMLLGMRAFEAQARALLQSQHVHVDSIYDPARIIKVIGTVSFKGPGTPERPHRVSAPLAGFDRREDEALVRRWRDTAPVLPLGMAPLEATAPPPASRPPRKRLPVVVAGPEKGLAEPLPVEMCPPVRRLWEEGAVDRSGAIFNLVRYFAYRGLSLARVTDLVRAYDERALGKLKGRDVEQYVRHAWQKVCATRREDGTIAPPCHALQKLGLCSVSIDPAARCQVYHLLFDLDAEIDQLPTDPGLAVPQLSPLLDVLSRKPPTTQAKYLKILSRHCRLSQEELRRRMPPRSADPE